MSEDTKNPLENELSETVRERPNIKELTKAFELRPVSSAEMIKDEKPAFDDLSSKESEEDALPLESTTSRTDGIDLSDNEIENLLEKNPVFSELAEPKLPELPKENRARLQMQSPNRLYFYWSIKNNPFQTLNRVFGRSTGNYTLIVRLINKTLNSEKIFPVEAEGSAWFDADADSTYVSEIGFYAAARPFVRLMFSNTIKTPRRNPSSRFDFSSDWAVSANQFAKVLDASGFAQDAVEVALAGDDAVFAETATQNAFSQVVGSRENDFVKNNAGEIRFVLLALASGYELENLRGQISRNLFAKLTETSENLSADKALKALQENFGEFAEENIVEFSSAVFGASSINFPRVSKRRVLPKFSPLSSLR